MTETRLAVLFESIDKLRLDIVFELAELDTLACDLERLGLTAAGARLRAHMTKLGGDLETIDRVVGSIDVTGVLS